MQASPPQPRPGDLEKNAPVLVVEDDLAVRETIQGLLEDEGIAVETVGDGQLALDHFARGRPALVILDMGLPLVDGYGVADGLHAAFGDSVPIVVVTADGRAAEKARRVGAVAYLHKPFELEDLMSVVTRALKKP